MSHPNDAAAGAVAIHSDVLVVDAAHSSGWINLREIWRYRDLVWIFAVRDIKVRYRQTAVGIVWTVLQPLGQLFAFGVLKQMLVIQPEDQRIPGNISMFCGLLLYQLFSGIASAATLSLVDNRQMVTKVYFPRVALPLSTCLRPMLDFGIGLIVLSLMMAWFLVLPSPAIVLAPIVVALTLVVSLSLGLWLSALNAHYRDFGYIVPFLLQLGLIISPVVVGADHVPARWRWLYFLNPMATLLDAFRWSVVGSAFPVWDEILISSVSSILLLISGAWYFHRVDRFMADNI
jgi:lipopolysaccharide transport system permease protein